MVLTQNPSDNNKDKPKIYPSWVGKECPTYIGYKLRRVTPTAQLDQWNSIPHDVAVDKVAKQFKSRGYTVSTEEWLEFEFSTFILAHRFDVIAKQDDKVVIVEVKPKDRSYQNMQYMTAQLLANACFSSYSYYVYEYENDNYVAKIPPNYDETLNIIEDKIDNALVELPMAIPSKACDFCPYATCGHHPQHDCSLLSGPFGDEECGCDA